MGDDAINGFHLDDSDDDGEPGVEEGQTSEIADTLGKSNPDTLPRKPATLLERRAASGRRTSTRPDFEYSRLEVQRHFIDS